MKLITASIGSYPRIGETRDHQCLVAGLRGQRRTQTRSPAIGFRDVQRSLTEEIIQEQIHSGIDHAITDGSWIILDRSHLPFCRQTLANVLKSKVSLAFL